MNIFALSRDPKECAQWHIDKHVVKMIVELAQILSSAHRLLDGKFIKHECSHYSLKKNFWLLPHEHIGITFKDKISIDQDGVKTITKRPALYIVNQKCYGVTHANHPSTVWARSSSENYRWLFSLFQELSVEYTHRYGKIHKTWKDLSAFLCEPPKNIPKGALQEFALAMPDEYCDKDPIRAYQNYYLGSKSKFARWTNRSAPNWFKQQFKDYDAANFERTTNVD